MSRDKHIRRTQDDYAYALAALLPQGLAWPRTIGSVLMRLLRGLAGIWGYIDGRAADLLEIESDPRKTVEILPEWERAFGLPDLCLAIPTDVATRQVALVKRMTLLGRQDRQFFIDIASSLGYVITIREFSPFQCGISRCGRTGTSATSGFPRWQIGHPRMRYFWLIKANARWLLWFHVGEGGYQLSDMIWKSAGQCGIDPFLRIGRNADLECILRRYKPAHTTLLFNYETTPTRPPPAQLRLVTYAPVVEQHNIGGSALREDGSKDLREDASNELRE